MKGYSVQSFLKSNCDPIEIERSIDILILFLYNLGIDRDTEHFPSYSECLIFMNKYHPKHKTKI